MTTVLARLRMDIVTLHIPTARNANEIRNCPSVEISEPEPVRAEAKRRFNVMQWNADGVSTKAFELRQKLLEDDIDNCLVQETKHHHHSRGKRPRFLSITGPVVEALTRPT